MSSAFTTYVEEIPDHECALDTRSVVDEALYISMRPTCGQRIRRYIQRTFLVSRKHPYTSRFFKSTTALSYEIIRHVKISISVIHPLSDFRSGWEIFMVFVYLAALLVIPYVVAFKRMLNDRHSSTMQYILLSIYVICFADIIVNFHSGFINKSTNEIILEKNRIARRYVLTYFFPDLFSSLPYYFTYAKLSSVGVFPPNQDWIFYLDLLLMLKFVRFKTLLDYTSQFAERCRFGFIAEKIITSAYVLVTSINGLACIFFFTSSVVQGKDPKKWNSESWLLYKNLGHEDEWTKFRLCLLRAFSVAFGCHLDFDFICMEDMITNMVALVFGLALLIYMAVQVVVITRIRRTITHKYEEMTSQLKEYVRYRQIPQHLEQRLFDYYKFCFQSTYFRETTILEYISGQLKQELLLHICEQLVKNVPFFVDIPTELMVRVVTCLKPEVVLVNDVVMKAGQHGDCMYFILSGTVAVYTSTGEEICHLHDGDYFGEIALVSAKSTRVASVVAVETSELYSLTRPDFIRAVKPFPALLERIEKTAKERLDAAETGRYRAQRQQQKRPSPANSTEPPPRKRPKREPKVKPPKPPKFKRKDKQPPPAEEGAQGGPEGPEEPEGPK